MTISKKIEGFLEKSSWIRKMFDEGLRLKSLHGAENVFDFSIGNPSLPPPERFSTVLRETVHQMGPSDHGYMPNMGYPFVRQAIAEQVSRQQQVPVDAEDVMMSCGAAGGLNAILKAILEPGDEVLTPAPCFVDYRFYVDNHGGMLKTVPTRGDFSLDLEAFAKAITPATKAVIIDSPNNPTGQVYSAQSLAGLGRILAEKGTRYGRCIYLISDEPYRRIVYDGVQVASIFSAYKESVVVTSHSKDLSLAGERIGYVAVNPAATHRELLLKALAFTNRVLGFINAPALMQRVVAQIQQACVDVAVYDRKRKLLCDGLADAGYDFTRPAGAFYLFAKSPIADDVAFVRQLQQELILAVPGTGFEGPGYFRLAFCVDDTTIEGAMPGFRRVMERCRMA